MNENEVIYISNRRVQLLCEQGRIENAKMISSQLITFEEVCEMLSVSMATGRNWVKLGKVVPVQKNGRQLLFERGDIDKILQDILNGESKALSRRRNKRKANGLSAL